MKGFNRLEVSAAVSCRLNCLECVIKEISLSFSLCECCFSLLNFSFCQFVEKSYHPSPRFYQFDQNLFVVRERQGLKNVHLLLFQDSHLHSGSLLLQTMTEVCFLFQVFVLTLKPPSSGGNGKQASVTRPFPPCRQQVWSLISSSSHFSKHKLCTHEYVTSASE